LSVNKVYYRQKPKLGGVISQIPLTEDCDMNALTCMEVEKVNGGTFLSDFGGALASVEGAAFFTGVAEGMELGSAAGPVGMIGGALVGAAVETYLSS
jgi:hypothetical protein